MADDKENNIHLEWAQSRRCHSNFSNVFINSFSTASTAVSLMMRQQSKSCEAALKNLSLIPFLHLTFHGHYQAGICQADVCFVGIDHTGQLILLCSCLAESNLLEEICSRNDMLVDITDSVIKKMFSSSHLSCLSLESCGLVVF